MHYFSTSDSVFEDEGAETSPTTSPAEDGDESESNPKPAETAATEEEQEEALPSQTQTGQNKLVAVLFPCSCW